MNGVYQFKNLSDLPQVCKMHPVYGGGLVPVKIVLKRLDSLVESKSGRPISEQPHYQYCIGNKRPYTQFLEKTKGRIWATDLYPKYQTVDQMHSRFDKILHSKKHYLEPPFENSYITTYMNSNVIFDGLHRACILLSKGVDIAPVGELVKA